MQFNNFFAWHTSGRKSEAIAPIAFPLIRPCLSARSSADADDLSDDDPKQYPVSMFRAKSDALMLPGVKHGIG